MNAIRNLAVLAAFIYVLGAGFLGALIGEPTGTAMAQENGETADEHARHAAPHPEGEHHEEGDEEEHHGEGGHHDDGHDKDEEHHDDEHDEQ